MGLHGNFIFYGQRQKCTKLCFAQVSEWVLWMPVVSGCVGLTADMFIIMAPATTSASLTWRHVVLDACMEHKR